MKKVLIIGGGASGMMAAIFAARNGAKVTILESNPKPGRKLLASGNGRCNLTNLDQRPECYHSADPQRAWDIISRFPSEHTIGFFTQLGIHMRNRDGWIYPYTEQSVSVLKVLEMEMEHLGVVVKNNETARELHPEDPFHVRTDSWEYTADSVIVACGSPASAVHGSSDSVLCFAEQAGVRTRPFYPALVPLRIRDGGYGKWSGVRVFGSAELQIDGRLIRKETGNLQLTDYGISGIPVFQLSGAAVRAVREGGRDVRVCLDFFPDMNGAELLEFLRFRRKTCPYKTDKQLLTGILPEQLIPVLYQKGDSLEQTAHRIKCFQTRIADSVSARYAQVSSGGVLLSELNENLESGTVPGLYFIGEAVDVDGCCGGYNLQWAWSSGYAAGCAAAL